MNVLNELRELVRLQLIQEAGVVDLANRQLERIGLMVYENGRMTSLIAISTTVVVEHEGVPIPMVLGLAQANLEYDANYRLHRLYADNAAVSVVLLAASLEFWKSVFTDHSVSPAAQQVIKRYYEQNKDNPALVEPGADVVGKNRNVPDYLRAAFLGPVGFDIEQALAEGEKAIDNVTHLLDESTREDVVDMIKDAADNGFDRAYNDISKTRHSLDDLFNASAAEDLLSELVKAIQKGGEAKSKALTWLGANLDDVRELMDAEHPNPRAWANIVEPALDKLNSGV